MTLPAEPQPSGRDPSLAAARVFLRPIANPFALGFLGLAAASLVLAGLELKWIPPSESVQAAVIILVTAPVLQLVASLFGFLGRDPVAATGMGLLAVSWSAIGASHLLSRPGAHSPALGTFLVVAAAGLLLSAVVASETKVLPAAVMVITAARFVATAVFEFGGTEAAKTASGVIGCILAAVALYGAVALEFEGLEHRTILPTFRRGRGRLALSPDLAEQVRSVAAEPGVRNQL